MGMTNSLAAVSTIIMIGPEACITEQKPVPFPQASIERIVPSEIGPQTSTLVRNSVTECMEGRFSRKDFKVAREQLGNGANSIDVECAAGPTAEIHMGIRNICSSSMSTTNDNDYVMDVDCAAGY